MKLIHKDKIETTICPTGGFCRGQLCSAFNWWYNHYIEHKVYYIWPNKKWYHWFRPLKKQAEMFSDFFNSEQPELERWNCAGQDFWDEGGYCYLYTKINPDARWSCGLNVENS